MKNQCKWDKKEILKKYFYYIKKIYINNEKTKQNIHKKDILKEIIKCSILKFPVYDSLFKRLIYLKSDMQYNSDFIKNKLTYYEKKQLNDIFSECLKNDFIIKQEYDFINNNKDYLKYCNNFFLDTNLLMKKELENSIKNNNLYIDSSIYKNYYAGSCWYVENKNYYHIIYNKYENVFLNICHEVAHGIVNINLEDKFTKNDSISLYREVLSLLVEIFANDYLFKNNIIDYKKYCTNFNDLFLTNVYKSIEIANLLYELAKSNITYSKKNIKKFIIEKAKENPTYNFKMYELNNYDLSYYLYYIYSFAIAASFYYNFKDNSKTAIDYTLQFLKEIKKDNEEKLFQKYNIDPLNGIKKYIDENNSKINNIKTKSKN